MNKRKAADFIIVMIVFSLAGITTMYISDYILSALSIRRWTTAYLLLFPFVLTPAHNVLLLFYAAFFGRFKYFWEREKKLLRFIFRIKKSQTEFTSE
jgi:manganese efflux pump family protein